MNISPKWSMNWATCHRSNERLSALALSPRLPDGILPQKRNVTGAVMPMLGSLIQFAAIQTDLHTYWGVAQPQGISSRISEEILAALIKVLPITEASLFEREFHHERT